MNNSERAAYIRGLMDGLELDPNSKETKVLNAMADLLEDLCVSMEEMEDSHELLAGQVDEIDEDLGLLEDDFYGEDDDDCCGCGGCGCDDDDDDFDDFNDEDECYFEVTCPNCSDTIELNEEMLDEGFINCPGCGEKLEFDFSEDEEEEKE